MPRGIDNNNPGNIRKGIEWNGLTEDQEGDEAFAQFSTPFFGIRAMFKILNTYKSKYNLDTVEGIITRWAPPNENNTDGYIAFVASKAKVGISKKLTDEDYLAVVDAIIMMENGEQPYTIETIKEGQRLANV